MKRFVVCSGRTIGELQDSIDRRVFGDYGFNGNKQFGTIPFQICPYGDMKYMNEQFVMCFIINEGEKK